MIHLSREKFTKEQMVEMERDICNTLEWKLHPPTLYVFLRHFLLLLQTKQNPVQQHDIMELARFLMELAALDYQFVQQRPSHIALAALLKAIEEKATSPTAVSGYFHEQHYKFLLSLVARPPMNGSLWTNVVSVSISYTLVWMIRPESHMFLNHQLI